MLPGRYATCMIRPATVLWTVSVVLLASTGLLLLLALLHTALGAHASDVVRDDVAAPFLEVFKSGAVDYDKAGIALGVDPYGGASAADRERFEERVRTRAFFAVGDPAADRLHAAWSITAKITFVAACGSLALAVVVGWQARRVRELE